MPEKRKIEEPSKTKAENFCLDNFSWEKIWLSILYITFLWKCSVFMEKTPTQPAKFSADNKVSFSCLQGNLAFHHCPRAKICTKPGYTTTHSLLFHGDERVYSCRSPDKTDSHANPNIGQTRTQAGPDKAKTYADRKAFDKNTPNARSHHADTNPFPADVSCATSNDHSSIITWKRILPIT